MPLAKATRHHPRSTLYRAIAREIAASTAGVLAVLAIAALANDLLGYSDLVVNRGLGTGEVARIAGFEAVSIVSTILPFAFLIGALRAFGRLAGDRELLALEASGVSLSVLLGPLLAISLAITGAALLLATVSAPWANRSIDERLEGLARTNPSALMRAGQTVRFGSWRIEADEVSADGRSMRGVRMFIPDLGETVFARTGQLIANGRGGNRIVLANGVMLLEPRPGPRRLRFEDFAIDLPRGGRTEARDRDESTRGLTLAELRRRIRPHGVAEYDPKLARLAGVELHRRFAWPAATLGFGLLVLPVLRVRGRFSRSGGVIAGAIVALGYYGLVQLGDGLAKSREIGVAAAVWLPNLALATLAAASLLAISPGSGARPLQREGRPDRFGRTFANPFPRRSRSVTAGHPEPRASRLHSRRYALDRYVAVEFLGFAVICTAILVCAYLLIDVLARVDWMTRYRPTVLEFLRYYAARAPLLVMRALPFSLLLATMLTVSRFSIDGEIVGMRASGIPLRRAFRPIVGICAALVPAYFALGDAVVPDAYATSRYVRDVVIKGKSGDTAPRVNAWYRAGDRVYELGAFDARAGRAVDVSIFEMGADGAPTSRTDAETARHQGDGVWRLENPTRYTTAGGALAEAEAEPFAVLGEGLEPGVSTRLLPIAELERKIVELEAAGYTATVLRVDYWVRLARPLACLLLPLVGLLFAVSGPPFPTPAMNGVAAAGGSIAYVLLAGTAKSLGHGGALPPIVAAFMPVGILGLIGAALAWRRPD